MGSKRYRVEVECECCDTLQLVRDHLQEAVRDAAQGRQVTEGLSQLLHLVRQAVLCCDHVHRSNRVGFHGADSAGEVAGQLYFEALLREGQVKIE